MARGPEDPIVPTGPELFCRYALPPNMLGYCGPDDRDGVLAVVSGLAVPAEEATGLARAFQGAWPYLELIGTSTNLAPLSQPVVEAYWIGNRFLDDVGLADWGTSVSDRFRDQAGSRWDSVLGAIAGGGRPNHAFHVFCVYPWVGMLVEGFVEPSLHVLDRCRISWGRVTAVDAETAVVRRNRLLWMNDSLVPGEPSEDLFTAPSRLALTPGDMVSLHWDYVCARLDRSQAIWLKTVHDQHLAIANLELTAARLEPSR